MVWQDGREDAEVSAREHYESCVLDIKMRYKDGKLSKKERNEFLKEAKVKFREDISRIDRNLY